MGFGAAEIAVLVILAVVLFGPEKLPGIARKAARVLRYVRTIANDATGQIRRELGPGYSDFDIRDLNPRTFVAKHLLGDVDPIIADVKRDLDQVDRLGRETSGDLKRALGSDAAGASNGARPSSSGHPVAKKTAKPAGSPTTGPQQTIRLHEPTTAGPQSQIVGSAVSTEEAATESAEQVAVAERPESVPTAPVTSGTAIAAAVPWDHEAT